MIDASKIKLKRAYEVSTKGLYQDESGRILVIQDEDGRWELPGGGLDHGEDIVESLKRECLEELGVSCEVVDAQPYKVWVGITEYNAPRLILLYRIKPLSFEFKNNPEAMEIKLITKEELKDLKLVPQLERIKELI
jgi:8-oxo-dGTP diphosphatase